MKRVKCFDNGGESFDRYTVVFLKAEVFYNKYWVYLAMSEHPCHPQGFGQHGELNSIKDLSYLGKRIRFKDLPPDCQKLVLSEA